LVTLKLAGQEDAAALLAIQKKAFAPLLEKCRDYGTSPAVEPLSTLKCKLAQRDYYFILSDGREEGLISVRHQDDALCVTPIGLLPEMQGRGVGKQAMLDLEKLYPPGTRWELGTILQEPGLCRFYEGLGYRRTGRETTLQPGMTEVGYEKIANDQ